MNRTRVCKWHGLAAYGLLGLPLSVLGLPLVVYLPQYYEAMPSLGVGVVGTMVVIARLFDVLTDPVVGIASDRWTTRFGRRKHWLAIGAPILMVAGWFLFVPGGPVSALYLLFWLSLAYLGWTLVYLPYTALGAEISSDYSERSWVTAAREGFLALGTLVVIMLPVLVSNSATGANTTSAAGLRAIAIFLLVTLPVATIWLLRHVDEPVYPRSGKLDWRRGWHILRCNRAFRRLLFTHILNGAANGLPAVLFLYFVMEILDASRAVAGIFLTIYFLSAVAGLPIWLWIGRNWSKHRLWCASMLFVSSVFIFTLLLGPGDLIAYGVICVLGGSCLGVDQAVPASIQADVVDEDTAAGGDSRAGIYFGLWSMATKLALALAVGVAFQALALVDFSSGTNNTATAQWTLKLLYGLLPVIIKLAVVPVMWRFPLDRARHAELQVQLGRR